MTMQKYVIHQRHNKNFKDGQVIPVFVQGAADQWIKVGEGVYDKKNALLEVTVDSEVQKLEIVAKSLDKFHAGEVSYITNEGENYD